MIKGTFKKGKALVAAATAAVLPVAAQAQEATNHAETAFNAMSEQANEFIGYAWPIVITIVGATIAIKLFKKFANRAS